MSELSLDGKVPAVPRGLLARIPLWVFLALLGGALFWMMKVPPGIAALPAAIELVCQLIGFPHRLANRAPGCFQLSDYPGLAYELRPNNRFSFSYSGRRCRLARRLNKHLWGDTFEVAFQTNSLGLRDREFTLHKEPNMYRILGLGDSPTFGEGVPFEEIYLKRLERRLNEEFPQQQFEVINAGVGGYNTQQELALLKKTGLGLRPDLVLLGYSLDDVVGWVSPRLDRQGYLVGKDIPFAWRVLKILAERSHFFRFLAYLRIRWFLSSSAGRVRHWYSDAYKGWQSVQGAFRAIQATCDRNGIELLVVLIPALYKLDDHYPGRYGNERVGEFCAQAGIRFLDLLPAFIGRDHADLWVHPSDIHPNGEAHEIIASALYHYLVSEGLVPGPR